MKMNTSFGRNLAAILGVAVTVGLSACGGGGGGGSSGGGGSGTVSGLSMPETMSVLTSDSGSLPAGVVTGLQFSPAAILNPLPGTGTDYASDSAHTYVYDDSMEALQTVNMILCLMGQTRASDMVNRGAYLALVDEDKCEQGQNQSSAGSSGQSSGRSVHYSKWTILSERADNSSPQYVKIWVPARGDGGPEDGDILVEVTINEGVSAARPYGSFALTFKGVGDAGVLGGGSPNGVAVETMKGTLRTVERGDGKVQFQFVNLGGSQVNAALPFGYSHAANVILDDANGTGGLARTTSEDNFGGSTQTGVYGVSFNTDLLRRTKTDGTSVIGDACLSRDPASFTTNVWRYNLYTTAGARKALNSGFPFTYNGKYGHVGYWGIWYENNATVPDGATIARQNYGNGTTSNYTVHLAPGKLIKRVRNTAPLADLAGADLYFWGPVNTVHGQYRVTLNGSNQFIATDSVTWGDNGRTLTDIADTDVTPAAGQTLFLWSDALGGNVVYVGGNTNITYYAEQFMRASDSLPTTLYCYDRCLKGGLTQSDVTAAGGNENALYHSGGAPYAYSVELASGKVLVKDHLGAVVDASGLDLTSVHHEWGIQTGEMVASTSGISNPWDVYSAAESYRWETGANAWNRAVTVRNSSSGQYESFDKPLQFDYTFDAGDNRNASAVTQVGKKFLLQYGGPGELWGFPWEEDGSGRWHSSVTLKDGVILNDGTTDYIVKAIEMEQTMSDAAPGSCTTAGLDTTAAMGLTMLTSSDIGVVGISLADRPNVTSAPAVIDGELQ
jgi:hypothetical protein